ncbi:MAG: nucleotidyltransferase domain-containing protein [Candidatus Omnitrophica bacterium]|nr:nucleotidyltransferase domain-containing protein [Candidatus Omnitrophota bacterium]
MRKVVAGLSVNERQALKEFRDRVASLLGANLLVIKLFGSKARGQGTPESDLDVFLAVRKRSAQVEDQVIDVAFDIDLKYGVYISPRVVAATVLKDPVWKATPFLQRIAKEGIPI